MPKILHKILHLKLYISPQRAFTLSEVLLTLAIIGVVGAMTIPPLIANHQKTVYVTQLKTVYTQLSSAITQMMADEGVMKVSDTDILTCQDQNGEDCSIAVQRAGNFLKKYFKIVKDCGVAEPNPCWTNKITSIDGTKWPGVQGRLSGSYCVIISTGTSVCIFPASQIYTGTIAVDINGLKKPNIAGRDIFNMAFYYDGSIDTFRVSPECRKGKPDNYGHFCGGDANAETRRNNIDNCTSSYYGIGCFGKILNDGWKMDY